jgi:hypothetical protein
MLPSPPVIAVVRKASTHAQRFMLMGKRRSICVNNANQTHDGKSSNKRFHRFLWKKTFSIVMGYMMGCHRHHLRKPFNFNDLNMINGGRGGIRTHGTLSRSPVFKTGSLNHSDTLPSCGVNWGL